MSKPLILISNDDGIDAIGIEILANSVSSLGKVVVVAPATEQSSMGRSYPRNINSGIIKKLPNIKQIERYSVTGSPAMAIAHAIEEILDQKPNICLTGINSGENIGSTMAGSGTVMGSIEASSSNLPAVAFSVQNKDFSHKEGIEFWSQAITAQVIKYGLPHRVSALNVNFPANVKTTTKVEYTTLSHQIYFEHSPVKKRDFSKPHSLQVIKKYNLKTLEKNSDIYCLLEKENISITPISWDFTAKISLDDLKDHLTI